MTITIIRRSMLLTSLFILLAAFGSANAQDCSTTTDDNIITAILNGIKSDSLLAPQSSHIVVGSVNKFVKLQGWTDNKRSYERLFSIVSEVDCVKAINVNNFEESPPPPNSPQRPGPAGCSPGTKPCGDVCIPEGDACSMKTKSAMD